MTITDEHFETLREVREAARDLRLACAEISGPGTSLHIAYDPTIQIDLSDMEQTAVQKLRVVK